MFRLLALLYSSSLAAFNEIFPITENNKVISFPMFF
jgi:hypothetical protein